MNRRGCLKILSVGIVLYAVGGLHSVTHADVTGSGLSTAVDNSTPGVYAITGGTRPDGGANLFHSFGNFSLGAAENANFLNDSGLATTNILARVTGGNPSQIFGTIDTSNFAGANLFLMNPSGILFGSSAQLNVDGSFHATTADYVNLGNQGAVFFADPTSSSVLSVAAPSGFGFLAPNPAGIDVNTSDALIGGPGQTLSFVGGTVNVGAADGSAPGYVWAPGGRVNLISVASPGEAAFDGTGFSIDGFEQLGEINVRGESIVDGANVYIRGGQLTIDDGIILPNASFYLIGGPAPDGGEVNVQVSGDVHITGTSTDPLTDTAPGIFVFAGDFFDIPAGSGKVPDINIDARSLTISGFAGIQTYREGPGAPGDVTINADTVSTATGGHIALINAWEGPGGNLVINAGDVTLSGNGGDNNVGFEGLAAQGTFHPGFQFVSDPAMSYGDSGSITLNLSGNLTVQGQAQITTDSLNFGRGGDININAVDMLLTGNGAESGLINAQSALAGDAGNITIDAAGMIALQDGFRISSSTIGSGDAGRVTVTAGESITFTGADSRILNATGPPPIETLNRLFVTALGADFETVRASLVDCCGLPADADQFAVLDLLNQQGATAVTDVTPGDAGSVTISTPLLTLNAGTRIEVSTGWEGNAGDVQADVGSLFVNDGGRITSQSGLELLSGEVAVGPGNAGSVNVSAADTVSVSGAGSSISTSTLGDGNAGDVSLIAGQVNIQAGASVSSASGGTINGQAFVGAGDAGSVTIGTTGALAVSGTSSRVSTATIGEGDGGRIAMTGKQIEIRGGGRVTAEASGTGSAGTIDVAAADLLSVSGTNSTVSTTTTGDGAGGSIALRGNKVQILDGGGVTSDSFGTGLTGNIAATADESIVMDGGTISTRAVTSDGGNIQLTATDRVYMADAEITTSVESGFGGGGNINIDPDFVIMRNGRILANAYGGPGGNIDIVAGNFIATPDSLVDASSALGIDGTVNISSPDQDVSQDLAVLPAKYLDVTSLISDRCGTTAGASSLVDAGPGGLAVNPDGYLPSFVTEANPAEDGKGGGRSVGSGPRWWAPYVHQSALDVAGITCDPDLSLQEDDRRHGSPGRGRTVGISP